MAVISSDGEISQHKWSQVMYACASVIRIDSVLLFNDDCKAQYESSSGI